MKRVFDCVISILGLIIVSPVLLVAMTVIRIDSGSPAIFAQTRIGRNARQFTCFKLRTMRRDTKPMPTHQLGPDALTRCGRLLRASKLDELPQLWNVIRGDMSLVGPRPCLPSQITLIEARRSRGVLDARPGITGLAQVQGIDMSDPVRLADIDSVYVRGQTFWGDVGLILRTLLGGGIGIDPATKSEPHPRPNNHQQP